MTQDNNKGTVLLTGMAGFIGFHYAKKILAQSYKVVGVDNLNDYYNPQLKQDRLAELGFSVGEIKNTAAGTPVTCHNNPFLTFYRCNLKEQDDIKNIFRREQPEYVIHLAAQAGVRYSIKNPFAYIDSNIQGFLNILESCRHNKVKHLVYASSSSVYGANENIPFAVGHNVDHPVSLYAATKKSNELMAHCYSHLYNIPVTGLRLFTVYGPWGRPDMAYYIFAKNITQGKPIKVFNQGNMKRDFTYIDDVVNGVYKIMLNIPTANPQWNGKHPDPASSYAPYRLYNIGNNQPIELLRFIEILEGCLQQKAEKKLLPMQDGDVPVTYADISPMADELGFKPVTNLETGLRNFSDWFKNYHGIKK